METVSDRLWQSSQSWYAEWVLRAPDGRLVRVLVCRNAYDSQSYGKAWTWSNVAGWILVVARTIKELPAANVSWVHDEDELLRERMDASLQIVLDAAMQILT